MKQLLFLFLAVIAFIVAVGLYSKTPVSQKTLPTAVKEEIIIGSTKISAEIADSGSERKDGLGGRESLGDNEGMLFVFPEKTSSIIFWMKDMHFAIDIIWIGENKIVKIDKNVQPEPEVSADKLKRYYPGTPVNFVLEVNAGFSDKNGFKVGDSVQIPPVP